MMTRCSASRRWSRRTRPGCGSCHRLLGLLVLGLAAVAISPALAAEKVAFNRDIRPILAENCFHCHGPDRASRKADLRLDRREVAVKMEVITPGKPDESALILRVFSDDPAEMMPPPSAHKKLTAAQKERLRQWIAAGAEYQPLWSFLPIARPPLPAVRNRQWVRNPIDRFVWPPWSGGMQPAAEADRRTLARRASLDLTGLPPSPAEVEALAADPVDAAYERFVDRQMQSPHWGEHRAGTGSMPPATPTLTASTSTTTARRGRIAIG